MWWIYRELYKAATPPADFDELVAKAPMNEFHQKEINFLDYTIPHSKMMDIINQSFVKYKIKSKYDKGLIERSILLGCSPKSDYDL